MVNVKIHEEDLLEMLVNRLRRWTDNKLAIEDYSNWYEDLINSGCFDGVEFDPLLIVDNDWVNYTEYISYTEFADWNIEDEFDDKILWVGQEGHYIIRTY